MPLFSLDLDRYKAWTIQQLYYLLYPYIKEDFMDRSTCKGVHSEGNMMAGDSIVTHITFRGGDDTLSSSKTEQYRLLAEEGELTLSTSQETGETTTLRG